MLCCLSSSAPLSLDVASMRMCRSTISFGALLVLQLWAGTHAIDRDAVYATQITFEASSPIVYTTTGICIGEYAKLIDLGDLIQQLLNAFDPTTLSLLCRKRSAGQLQNPGLPATATGRPCK